MAKYLIIGGTTKAGTTAVFDYLARHTSICAANLKETRFFLDAEYPVLAKSVESYENGLERYYNFFAEPYQNNNIVFLEATPDYMYSKGTAQRIKSFCELGNHQSKLVFILRNPVERFVSWFYFGKQLGDIPQEMTFEQFYLENLKKENAGNNALTALEKGLYSNYLKKFVETFGKENLVLVSYSNFRQTPKDTINKILQSVQLGEISDDNFHETKSNETYKVKSRLVFKVLRLLRRFKNKLNSPFISQLAKNYVKPVANKIVKINSGAVDKKEIEPAVIKKVEDYYAGEKEKINVLFDALFEW